MKYAPSDVSPPHRGSFLSLSRQRSSSPTFSFFSFENVSEETDGDRNEEKADWLTSYELIG